MSNISVAIACYNARMFISDTLKSLGRQSRLPDKNIVVDDGSTDNNRAVIDGAGEIRVIVHKTNMGLPRSAIRPGNMSRGRSLPTWTPIPFPIRIISKQL
jgi:GT2 family glycosyltransferase